MRRSPDHILRLVAFGLAAIAALFAAVELANTVTPQAPLEPSAGDDPLQAELSRCRTMTPEDMNTDTTCRAAWAEQRRRFLGLSSRDPEKE
ncbi:putative entry exclusion protein TrbK-alt [Psychromarinibacter sp. C21-152]|uniref:Entry exclusion protein TrbK-alt n=1 Tax=Psychromarinibacter sediminicola TaxID=3033385 RepID=A0AAE3T8Y4_9RHOB|nr:putative entry exclusion protein TrbK-alt [Psychromarinibacter sediminicola]MDF0601642.1 putative entry exclusion protein TrbK-alt [Psychromarinibacter sediminicola]